jgi:hypothetical protein
MFNIMLKNITEFKKIVDNFDNAHETNVMSNNT